MMFACIQDTYLYYLFAGKDLLGNDDIDYAYDKKLIGVDKKSRVREEERLKITAVHEAGHTLVAYYTKEAEKIHKVTINAKGNTGGHMASVPSKESFIQKNRNELLADICVGMGGRAAEELVFGLENITGGAISDLENATEIGKFIFSKYILLFSFNYTYLSIFLMNFFWEVGILGIGPPM